jgi:hypothetical protein
MRTWIIDQFEFERPGTEERLEVSAASAGSFPFPDVQAFVASAVGVQASTVLPAAVPFADTLAYGYVRQYLAEFTGITLPRPCNWPTYVLSDGPDEWQLVLCSPDGFIHYYWSTSA